MTIVKIEVGYLKENCYILSTKNNVLIVDPGDEAEKIINLVGDKKVLAILVTHYHFDHVGALEQIKNTYNAPVIDYKCDKNQKIGPFDFEIIETKGHKNDSVTYYFKKDGIMFVGDFIFKGTIGRCDLLGGDFNEMLISLDKIKKYDDSIILYPGHGEKTTLKEELINNKYLKGD